MPLRRLTRTWQCSIACLAAAVLVLPAAWFVLHAKDVEHAAARRTAVVERLGAVRAGIETALAARLTFLRALQAFAAHRPDLTEGSFTGFARDLIGETPAIRSVQLARDNVVSHIYPREGSPGILGLRLPQDLPADQAAAVDHVLATGQPVLTGPVRLLQGGLGLIARAPVRMPGDGEDGHARPWGLATVIIDAEAFFHDADLTEARGIRLAIRGDGALSDGKQMIFGDPALFADRPVLAVVPVPGGTWELAAIPASGRTRAPRGGLLAGAIGSWLVLTAVIWGFLSWPARLARAVDTATAALARARDNLEREVGERTRELRVANEALRQSEQRYRIFIDATSDMVFLKDEKLHHVVANRALATFLGREPRDVVGLDDFALMPADLAASCQDTDLQAIAGQATVTTLQSQGGRMFEVRKFPAPLGSGRTGVGGIIRDVTDRFRAEQAVRESESALRGLRDNAPVGIFTSTPDGRYLTVNACLARMYGYTSAEEMLALVNNIQDQHYSDPDERDAMFGTLDAAGVIAGYETRRVTRSGDVIWVLLNMRALRDASGAVFRYEGFCMDISKRKRVEAALAHQERQLRVIFDNSPLGLVYFDSQGAVIKCNARFLELVGTTAERVEGKRFLALLPDPVREALAHALHGEPALAEGPYPSVNGGNSLYARAMFNPVEPGNSASEVIATVEDIGAAREREASLRLLWAAVEASPASIVITDAQGNIEYVNPHFTALTGYTPDEARGRNPSVLKSGIHEDVFYREMWETLAAGRVWRGEFCNRKKNGELYWEDSSISPIRDETGAITHYMAVKEDITARKELEKIREDVERIMRHDLKAPLNSILNLPDLVRGLGELTADQEELLGTIEQAGQAMLDQIELSLALYKMETGTYVPALQRVDLLFVLRNVVGMLANLARSREVTVAVAAEPAEAVFARADAVLCQTICSNLLKNAIEASAAGQTVTVRLFANGQVHLAVHNPGEVEPSIRPVFFEKYATFGKADGNGLGTYSARLMTECQGGNIRLDSSAADGTTVTVTLSGPDAPTV